MRDCIKRFNNAINCTETTEVPIRPGQNNDTNQADTGSHSLPGGQTHSNDGSNKSGDRTAGADRQLWYADGLKFECTQCGDCCTGGPGAVWVTDEELNQIASALEKTVGEVRLLHTKLIGNRWSLRDYPNGDCVFLDPQTRGCQIYADRPIQCRTWPFWPSNIDTTTSWKRTCDVCPGAGQGKLHSLEVIQTQSDACDI